jgi:hypothetical protein
LPCGCGFRVEGLKTGDRPEDTGAYAFARANLLALWYGKVAAVDGMAELQKAQEENAGPFSVLAAMMRGTKLGTNDYVCAKRAISRFGVPQSGKNIQTMAELLTAVYTTHILINEATLKVFVYRADLACLGKPGGVATTSPVTFCVGAYSRAQASC